MKLLFHNYFPYLFSYSDSLKEWQGGVCRYSIIPIVLIRPKYRNDPGLHAHELQHVHQFYHNGLWCHARKYKKDMGYRLRCEVEAYSAQIRQYPPPEWGRHISYFAKRITEVYNITTPYENVRLMLEMAVMA